MFMSRNLETFQENSYTHITLQTFNNLSREKLVHFNGRFMFLLLAIFRGVRLFKYYFNYVTVIIIENEI